MDLVNILDGQTCPWMDKNMKNTADYLPDLLRFGLTDIGRLVADGVGVQELVTHLAPRLVPVPGQESIRHL
jgi:hypothetical protein